MPVIYYGKQLVVGDVDPSITLRNLRIDWVSEGYTMNLEVIDPDGVSQEYPLDAVSGQPYSAKLDNVKGIFTRSGEFKVRPIAYKGGVRKILEVGYAIRVSD